MTYTYFVISPQVGRQVAGWMVLLGVPFSYSNVNGVGFTVDSEYRDILDRVVRAVEP